MFVRLLVTWNWPLVVSKFGLTLMEEMQSDWNLEREGEGGGWRGVVAQSLNPEKRQTSLGGFRLSGDGYGLSRRLLMVLVMVLLVNFSMGMSTVYLTGDPTKTPFTRCSPTECTEATPCYYLSNAVIAENCHVILKGGTYEARDGVASPQWSPSTEGISLTITFSPLVVVVPLSAAIRIEGRYPFSEVKLVGTVIRRWWFFISARTLRMSDINFLASFRYLGTLMLATNCTFELGRITIGNGVLRVFRSRLLGTWATDDLNSPSGTDKALEFISSQLIGIPYAQDQLSYLSSGTFYFDDCSVSNYTIHSTSSLAARNTNFTDVSTLLAHSPSLANVNFVQNVPNRQVIMYSILPLEKLVSFTFSNPNRHRSSYFGTTYSAIFSPESVIKVSDLVLIGNQPTTLGGSWEITNSIRSEMPDGTIASPTLTFGSYASDTTNLHSIYVENVAVQFSAGQKLIYTASDPETGIILNGTSSAIGAPAHLSIRLPPGITSLDQSRPYPLVNLAASEWHTRTTHGDYFKLDYSQSQSSLNFTLLRDLPSSTYSCDNPPPGFACSAEGTLYSLQSVNEPNIIMPPQSGNIVVVGDVETGTITFQGTGSTLSATGCVTIGSDGIVLDLDSAPKKGTITLISQSPKCSGNLHNVPLTVKTNKKSGCERTKVKADSKAPPNQLVALLEIDKSRCNTKWIIVGAVLGSVVLILLIVMLVLTLHPKVRMPCRRKTMIE